MSIRRLGAIPTICYHKSFGRNQLTLPLHLDGSLVALSRQAPTNLSQVDVIALYNNQFPSLHIHTPYSIRVNRSI